MKTNKINRYLENITRSKEFSESKRYQRLISYLVDSTLQDITPKEITIAHDVFGKSIDLDKKNDTQVRVYIHNLRKKLDSYYQHEGKNDEIIFEIPKGHYKVIFREKNLIKKACCSKNIIIANAIIFACLIIFNVFLLNRSHINSTEAQLKKHPVWSDFLNSDEPVLIVIGDYYLYRVENLFDQNSHLYIRDYNINSDSDFDAFAATFQSSNEKVEMTNHTLLGKFAPWTVSELTRILHENHKEFDMKLSSHLQFQDMDKYNIIFVGTFKSLGILNELISDLNFSYKVKPNTLIYHEKETDSLYSYISTSSTIESAYEDDYSLVAKMPISNHTSIMIFGSTRDIGIIATVKHLTNPKTLIHFEKEHDIMESNNPYFESVFKIQGFERNVNSVDILHFDSINTK